MGVAENTAQRSGGRDWTVLLRGARFVMPLALIAIISFVSPSFFTVSNGINILRQSSLLFILAAGQTLVILTGGIDLSVGAVLGLTACLAGSIIIDGGGNVQGIVFALALGTVLGLLNGVMVARIRLPAFIATYGMMMLARGLAVAYMQGNVHWGFNRTFRVLGAGSIGAVPVPVVMAAIVFVITHLGLHYSTLGRSIYYIGNNKLAARLSGFRVDRILVLVYAIEGFIAAFAGLMYVSRLNSAEASLGTGFEMDAVAAVIVGGTSFFGAEGNITNAVFGALIITLLRNAMNLVGISSYWQPFVIGFLIVVIVLAERSAAKARGRAATARGSKS